MINCKLHIIMQLKFSTLQMLFLVARERAREKERGRENGRQRFSFFHKDGNMVVWLFLRLLCQRKTSVLYCSSPSFLSSFFLHTAAVQCCCCS